MEYLFFEILKIVGFYCFCIKIMRGDNIYFITALFIKIKIQHLNLLFVRRKGNIPT